jgi:NtrC-family two-component system response regulator AlgB
LQNKEFERVGESITRKVDVRIIAATNRDLDEALQKGIIRDDLFYRISAVRLKLLPLRERLEDIPVLAFHFLKKYSQHPDIHISPEVMHALRIYPWPGNVRELENVIERASLLAQNKVIELPHLPEEIQHAVASNKQPVTLEEIERAHIEKVLKQSRDFEEAAHILGIDTSTLWRKRKKYGL